MKPTSVYRREFESVALPPFLISELLVIPLSAWTLIGDHSIVWMYAASVLQCALLGATYYFAHRKALIRCQAYGILQYVRSREVLTLDPVKRRPGAVSYWGSKRKPWTCFAIIALFGYYFDLLFVSYPYNPFLTPSFGVLALPFLISALIFSRYIPWFSITPGGIRVFLRTIPWSTIHHCHIDRHYAGGVWEGKPMVKARLFNEKGRRLVTLEVSPIRGAEDSDYNAFYEALLANMGYPPHEEWHFTWK